MKKTIITLLAVALCGCATTATKTTQPKTQHVLKRPAIDVSKISPTKKALAPLRSKSLSQSAAMPGVVESQPDSLIVTYTRVEGGITGEPGTYGYRYDCEHPTNVHGYVWISIGNWHESSTWALPFNATDTATNASSYAPCMVRKGQSNEKFVPQIFTEFRGSGQSAQKALTGDSFASKWEAKKKELGADARNWAMTPDGHLIHLE